MNHDRASNRSRPWESGAEDARTPNADASSADSAGSANRLECVRFIGAFDPAQDGQQFIAAMHAKKRKEALHEATHPRPIPRGGFMVAMYRIKVVEAFHKAEDRDKGERDQGTGLKAKRVLDLPKLRARIGRCDWPGTQQCLRACRARRCDRLRRQLRAPSQ